MNKSILAGLLVGAIVLSGLVQAAAYSVETVTQRPVENALPALPDLSGYNRQAVLQKQAQWQQSADVDLDRMINNVATRKFFKGGK